MTKLSANIPAERRAESHHSELIATAITELSLRDLVRLVVMGRNLTANGEHR